MPVAAITRDVAFAAAPFRATSSVGNKVRLHVPATFDATAPFMLCVFLHGWEVERGSREAQIAQAVAQMVDAHKNVMLIAPRFGTQSEEGSFGNATGFSSFVQELESALPPVLEQSGMNAADAAAVAIAAARTARIVIVAFSGGWKPLGVTLNGLLGLPTGTGVGAATQCADRIIGIALLDCIYGKTSASAVIKWSQSRGNQTALLGIYGRDTARGQSIAAATWNPYLLGELRPGEKVLTPSQWSSVPSPFPAGHIAFFEVPTGHMSIPDRGPPVRPIAAFLDRLA